MNYLAWVSNGVYGASTDAERANLFASWGLMDSLSGAPDAPDLPNILFDIMSNIFQAIMRAGRIRKERRN